MDISDLKFDDKNFNKHTQKGMGLLEKSLQQFGAGRSILIDKDNNIIAGNGIIEAAGNIGLEDLQIVETDGTKIVAVKRTDITLDSAQGRQMALADNATAAEDLSWDKGNIEEVSEQFGIDPGDWISDWDKDEDTEVEEDEAPEVDESEPAKSELGKVYKLGEHRLMCGDSTDAGNVAILMDGQKVDMVFTDPPYNVNYSGRGEDNKLGPIKNDNMSDEDFESFCHGFFSCYSEALKPLGCIYVCHPDSASAPKIAFEKTFAEFFRKSSTIIWAKQSAGMGWQDYRAQHEPILYGWKEGKGEHQFYGGRTKTTVWNINRDNATSYKHPTQKPIALPAEAIKNSSKESDAVLDLFGGSGSTLIACEQLGRQCYMMELDPKYCDVIRKRYWKLTHDGNEEGWEEGTPAWGK